MSNFRQEAVVVEAESRMRHPGKMLAEFWFYFSQNKGAVIGLVVFIAPGDRGGVRAADRAA
jgi:dipeptide transport system permease protein